MQQLVPYPKAFGARAPREVVIGLAKDVQGKYNPITLGMFTHVAINPPVLAVSIANEQYSLQAFRLAKEFIIALPSAAQADEALLYGTKSGRDCDKLALAVAKVQPATQIDCVLLSDACANYECKLIQDVTIGDHAVLFGQVVATHLHEPPLKRLYVIGPGHKMGPLRCL